MFDLQKKLERDGEICGTTHRFLLVARKDALSDKSFEVI